MNSNYALSYMVGTVNWDGQFVSRLPDEDFIPRLQLLKSLGINEVMLTGYVTVEEANFDMMEETKRIGGLLDSMGMKPSQHHGLSAMFAPPEESQDRAVEKLIRSVQYTANMNAAALVIHPGHVDLRFGSIEEYNNYFHEQMEKIGRRELMRLCAANLDAAGEVAGKLGVKIGIENVHLFDSDITLMRDLLAEVKSPNVGFCLDSGHANYRGNGVLPWLEEFGKRIVTTHFHDNCGDTDSHFPPGFGTIPWIPVIRKLRDFGYSDSITFESGPWPGFPPDEGYRHAIAFWRALESLAV